MSVEEPPFTVRLRDGRFEVRDYPSLVVAEVDVSGDQSQAANAGFRALAGYIFGANARRESIAMTAPVTLLPNTGKTGLLTSLTWMFDTRRWVVRFTMPKGYSLGALPQPKDTRVRLRMTPPTRFATIRFSGLAHEQDVKSRTGELDVWLQTHKLKPAGAASLAQYDPPWTLWFLRRNEVMIPVVPGG